MEFLVRHKDNPGGPPPRKKPRSGPHRKSIPISLRDFEQDPFSKARKPTSPQKTAQTCKKLRSARPGPPEHKNTWLKFVQKNARQTAFRYPEIGLKSVTGADLPCTVRCWPRPSVPRVGFRGSNPARYRMKTWVCPGVQLKRSPIEGPKKRKFIIWVRI